MNTSKNSLFIQILICNFVSLFYLKPEIRQPFSSILCSQVDRLKAELMYERRMSEDNLSRFEDERRVWQEEKEKVKTEERFRPFPRDRWFTLAL